MISRIAFVGRNPNLRLFFSLVGVECFDNISDVGDSFSVVLVEEPIFRSINLRKYLGELLIIPFRTTRKQLSVRDWFNDLLRGELK